EPFDEGVGPLHGAALEVDERPVDRELRQPRERPEGDLLDAGLRGCGESDGVPVAAQAPGTPQNVDDGFFLVGSHSHVGITPRFGGEGSRRPMAPDFRAVGTVRMAWLFVKSQVVISLCAPVAYPLYAGRTYRAICALHIATACSLVTARPG